MLIGILYFFIIMLVISISAIAGISGGVVLRPIFDLIGYHDVREIAFYMAIAVITMSITSTIKQLRLGTKIKFDKALTLALGAIIGGWVGQEALQWMDNSLGADVLQMFQNIISLLLLSFILLTTRLNIKTYQLKGTFWYVLAGFGLGGVASVLSIGGGPINVVAFTILFGITLKEATVYSITTILFTQLARLLTMARAPEGLVIFDMNLLWFIIPAAITGGYVGGKLNVKLSDDQVIKVFKFVVIGTILINVWNTIKFGLALIA